LFDTLDEAKVMVERWRHEYNRIRPHSSLDYRPPAPETKEPMPPGSATLHPPALASRVT
ncbi:MAG: integrase core domain-containing protein, partial [Nitrospinota bacterium]